VNGDEIEDKDLGPRDDPIDGDTAADWRGLFSSERTLGNLQFFVLKKSRGRFLFFLRRMPLKRAFLNGSPSL
jgi:hypothetical protein